MDTMGRFGLVIESMVWIRTKKKKKTNDLQFTVCNIHHTCYYHHYIITSCIAPETPNSLAGADTNTVCWIW